MKEKKGLCKEFMSVVCLQWKQVLC